MGTNKMREQFEAAIVAMKMATGMPEDDAKSFLEVGSNGYTSVYTKAAWWAWQASREHVLVELPDRFGMDGFCAGLSPDEDGPVVYVDDVIRQIETHGLRVAT